MFRDFEEQQKLMDKKLKAIKIEHSSNENEIKMQNATNKMVVIFIFFDVIKKCINIYLYEFTTYLIYLCYNYLVCAEKLVFGLNLEFLHFSF